MNWIVAHRAHQATRKIADEHYSRQKPGTPQFVPPGRCVVLRTLNNDAYWVTSWPLPEFVKHAWPGAWVCSAFRRRPGAALASQLVREAVAATRWIWPDVPDLGMVTFVDPTKVLPRAAWDRQHQYGRCFIKAGFVPANPPTTEGGLIALQLLPTAMPGAEPPVGAQFALGLGVVERQGGAS